MICLTLFWNFLMIGTLSFGGGYGMISLVREVVLGHGWLTESEFLSFIAVSESTPGPLAVNMATFIGSSQAGLPGALVATLGVVLPSFLIIFGISFVLRAFQSVRLVQYAFNGIRAGVLALIIGFGAESLIADVITGTFMLFEHQYEVGDIIVVGDFRGTVTQIGIRTTQIMDSGGNVKIINNSDIRSLINRSNDLSFAVCDMAVPYDKESLARAEKVLGEVLPKLHREHPDLFSKAPAYLGVQSLDYENRAVVLRVAGETHEENIYKAQRLLNRTLFMAFEEEGLSCPVHRVELDRE